MKLNAYFVYNEENRTFFKKLVKEYKEHDNIDEYDLHRIGGSSNWIPFIISVNVNSLREIVSGELLINGIKQADVIWDEEEYGIWILKATHKNNYRIPECSFDNYRISASISIKDTRFRDFVLDDYNYNPDIILWALDCKISINDTEYDSGTGNIISDIIDPRDGKIVRNYYELYETVDNFIKSDKQRQANYEHNLIIQRELEIRAAEEEKQAIIEAGKKGEQEVEYQIQWLGDKFTSLKKDFDEIILNNTKIPDQPQEYDHIVVSEHAVYLIETKNYKGEIIIYPNGNWVRVSDNGREKGIDSPTAQSKRHHILMENILSEEGINAPIVDIICIANSSAIIKGDENSSIPVVKVDALIEYVESIEKELSKDPVLDKNAIIKIIRNNMVETA